jgi:sarcosine oxidase subunit gamma
MSEPTISPGVVAASRDTLAIARLAARKGRAADLTSTVRGQFGIELPNDPQRVRANELAFIGVGVATWLAVSECELANDELDGFAASLRNIVDESATVSDQIGACSVLRLTGRHVTAVLAKFVALDLHPRIVGPGSAASTLGSHIPLTLWRLEDSSAGLAVFELAVPRSYTTDFRHLLSASAAVFAAAAG